MLQPGTRIGTRYTIDRLLGQGGMSNLYLAIDHTQANAVRVIKEMTARYPDPNEQKAAEQLFMREAQLLATLNHPNIPKVFDKFIFQGKYYLSMEYVQGEDLGKLITDRGTIEEKLVASYGAQMATVLYYLHQQKPPIVFRDVKPSNIMIANDQVKLIDFGIARMFTPAKKGDTMRIGSPGYAPPEQYGGQTDPRSDIYALGVTLHHAATGYDPTISQTPFIIPPARQLNPKVSAEMEAVITRATQLDPDKRYQNCLEMKRELQNVMRMHGMNVGSSMPFSALNQPQVQTAPPPGATVPKLPPSMAQAAAAAQAQAAVPAAPAGTVAAVTATSPATTPGPTPAPAPTPTPAPAGAKKKKGRGAGLLLALMLVGGTAVAAVKAPAELRNQAWTQLKALVLQFVPGQAGPSLSDGEKVLLFGGPLSMAAEELGKVVREGKATPAQQLTYQNALVYGSGRPVKRLAVLAPAELPALEGAALWQRLSWEENNREGSLLVLTWQPVENEDGWRRALARAASGQLFREGKKPDALLVFPPANRPPGWKGWFESTPPLYWGAPVGPEDPKGAHPLEVGGEPHYSELLKNLGLGNVLWVAHAPKAPTGVPSGSVPDGEAAARILKQKKAVVIIDPSQVEGLKNWPKMEGVRLVCLYPAGTLPLKPPEVPPGLQFSAVTQGSQFHSNDKVARFFQFEVGAPDAYDHLSWAGSSVLGLVRQTGLSWHSDRSGALSHARWSLLDSRGGRWYWVKDGEDG